MRAKTEIELRKSQTLKVIRAAVVLRHRIAADAELNAVLPEAEKAFDKAVLKGSLPDRAASDVMREFI